MSKAASEYIEEVAREVFAANSAGGATFDQLPHWRRAALMTTVGGAILEPEDWDADRFRAHHLDSARGLLRGVRDDLRGRPDHRETDGVTDVGPVNLEDRPGDAGDERAMQIIRAAAPGFEALLAGRAG